MMYGQFTTRDDPGTPAAPHEGREQPVAPPVFACDLTALTWEQRAQHHRATTYLLTEAVQEIQALPQGYAFRFAADTYATVAEFVALERLCCPFVTFAIEVQPDRGPIWLRLTGPEGAKEFLRLELNLGTV